MSCLPPVQRERDLHEGGDQFENDQDHDRRFESRRAVGIDDIGQRLSGVADHFQLAFENVGPFVQLVFVRKARVEALKLGVVPQDIRLLLDGDEQKSSSGPIQIKNLSPPRFLVIADALAKTVALARDEREVNAVFDVIEPFAAKLAATGRPPFRRRAMLRLIGQALLAQHRVSGRVAVEEKPDVLWDHPELERLYARLTDEYELHERSDVLKRKLEVIGDTAQALTDIIDADRATRLEATVAVLIVFELIASLVQIYLASRGR